MAEGEKCTFTVEGVDEPAHVMLINRFENDQEVGVLWNGYQMGQVIEVPPGMSQDITIYNSIEGTARVIVSYRSANGLALATATMLLTLVNYL